MGKEGECPHSLITDEGVKLALKEKCGEESELKEWKAVEFLNKGDHHSSHISCINVDYTRKEENQKTSFVVKINPLRSSEESEDMSSMFEKEGGFYSKIIPELNKLLQAANEVDLRFPKCYHTCLEKGKEIIFLEDLRNDDFKTIEKTSCLDLPRLVLILNELGRLHASSILYRKSKSREELMWQFPFLKELCASEASINRPEMKIWAQSIVDGAATILECVGGYTKAAEEIRKLDIFYRMMTLIEASTLPFEVFCHGVCWTNNFLFK